MEFPGAQSSVMADAFPAFSFNRLKVGRLADSLEQRFSGRSQSLNTSGEQIRRNSLLGHCNSISSDEVDCGGISGVQGCVWEKYWCET